MTADEFIASISDFSTLPTKVQCDLLSFYLLNEAGAATVTGSSIASLRSALHLPTYARVSTYLAEEARKGARNRGRYVKQKKGYVLERSYAEAVKREYLGRPVTKHLAAGLRSTLSATKDPAISAYLEEAISCFENGFTRSALVMSWCVAYGLFRAWLFRNHLSALNAEMSTWKAPRKIATLEDFQEMTEGNVIETARKAKILSKEQYKVLKHLLDERNSFAHPTTRALTPAMTEAYIEGVVHEIIPNFG